MKRIDYIRNMTVEEIANIIIKSNTTDEYCKSDCEDTWEEPICQDEMGCCIKWLNEEMEENQ